MTQALVKEARDKAHGRRTAAYALTESTDSDAPVWRETFIQDADLLTRLADRLEVLAHQEQALRAALTEVSSQTIPGDRDYGADMEEDWEGGDWEGGFCILVRRARAALDSLDQAVKA